MPLHPNQIGVNAGRVWGLLSKEPNLSKTAIAKRLSLRPSDVALALGWLARENKLVASQSNYVFTPTKQTITLFCVKD